MKEKKHISQEDFEQIESYLLNRMSEKEKQIFLKEMEADKELKEEFKVQRQLIASVEAGAFKDRLEKIHQKIIQRRQVTWWFAAVASVAVLLVAGIWLLNRPTQSERLFAENLTEEPGLPVPMSAVDDYDFYDAMVDYKSGEYELAIEKWMQLLKKDPENDTLNYFIGIALFNDKKFDKAEPFFEKAIQLKSAAFEGKSEWYLALVYLKTGETDKLRQLSKESHSDYTQRINQIIQRLE